mgnify:CR=1 FL=1
MINEICLNKEYSTTKLLIKEKDKSIPLLFLSDDNKKSQGGLRTTGYFKKSFDDKPLITIITVVFNGEQFLEETILSVIRQNYDNVEYIIIDGGSTDKTIDLIKKYEDKIDYWISEKDRGIYDAMNKGIDLVNGDWLNFMNAGDILKKDIIYNIINILNKTNKICLYGLGDWVNGKKPLNKLIPILHKMPNHQAMFVRAIYMKKNKFDLKYKIIADLDNKLSIYKDNGYFFVNEVITISLEGGLSQDISNFKILFSEHVSIAKKYNGYKGVLSICLLFLFIYFPRFVFNAYKNM